MLKRIRIRTLKAIRSFQKDYHGTHSDFISSHQGYYHKTLIITKKSSRGHMFALANVAEFSRGVVLTYLGRQSFHTSALRLCASKSFIPSSDRRQTLHNRTGGKIDKSNTTTSAKSGKITDLNWLDVDQEGDDKKTNGDFASRYDQKNSNISKASISTNFQWKDIRKNDDDNGINSNNDDDNRSKNNFGEQRNRTRISDSDSFYSNSGSRSDESNIFPKPGHKSRALFDILSKDNKNAKKGIFGSDVLFGTSASATSKFNKFQSPGISVAESSSSKEDKARDKLVFSHATATNRYVNSMIPLKGATRVILAPNVSIDPSKFANRDHIVEAGQTKNLGIMKIKDALNLAKQLGLDLLQIDADGKVCKILDFLVLVRKENAAAEEARRKDKGNRKANIMKEVRLTPVTADNDLALKIKQVRSFLEDKRKVRVFVMFRKGMRKHHDEADKLLDRLVSEVEDLCKVVSRSHGYSLEEETRMREAGEKIENVPFEIILAPLKT